MAALDLVRLTPLMELTRGRPEVVIGLIDGPLVIDHPDLAGENIREISGEGRAMCAQASSLACAHGTFVGGILAGRRGSPAPSICPGCTLLVRPVFAEAAPVHEPMPSATPASLAAALIETIDAGAQVINLSAALVYPSPQGERDLHAALDYAARRSVIIVAAAGNQAAVGSTCITRHPWVIPVVACDLEGRPLEYSNLGNSISRRGLCAPGHSITSLGTDGKPRTFGGTSAAAPFVTGALALLLSEFPGATSIEVKFALGRATGARRRTVVPPLMNAWTAFQILASSYGRG